MADVEALDPLIAKIGLDVTSPSFMNTSADEATNRLRSR